MPCILKDEPVNIFAFFEHGIEEPTKFTVRYEDSASRRVYRSELVLTGKEHNHPFLEKLAQHKKIELVCEAIRNNQAEVVDDAMLGEVGDLTAYAVEQSVRHQVLCEHTAFICIGKSLRAGEAVEYEAKTVNAEKEDEG